MKTTDDLFNLSGRTVLITGGAGHIARRAAAAFLERGADLILVDRHRDVLASAQDSLSALGHGGTITTMTADLEQPEDVAELIQRVHQGVTKLDALINAAAFVGTDKIEGWGVPFLEQSLNTWRRCLEVNLTAPFALIQGLYPLMEKAPSPAIVNISSIYGQVGPDMSLYEGTTMGNPAAYAASKAGLAQLTRWLCTTLPSHFRVNTVTPGGVERGQNPEFRTRYIANTASKRMATEEDLVGVLLLLVSDAGAYITGQDIAVDGGWTAK
ncbi:SDR family oxidoreductase [Maribrevibacterium harenarium]|uniref:SDR family oxidoreductase n=1 Tax=Maribrevibacterium harenarium TaxID=2589817 RepID=A0A501X339_9GAMM|nr:SDR family oxidoreductase [Maribrevibacterium harenarium]TPE54902.1 SDR family oxidoreductase [Maribrevibacterium harenarium]